MAATVTLAYLNLAGSFIGTSLEGLISSTAQDMDRLALQVAAKLVVRESLNFFRSNRQVLTVL